jgi:hypothetical protein
MYIVGFRGDFTLADVFKITIMYGAVRARGRTDFRVNLVHGVEVSTARVVVAVRQPALQIATANATRQIT